MPAEPVAPLRLAFAGVPRLGVHGGNHPVRGHPAGNAPPPVRPVRFRRRLHVLPGHQRQQPQRVRCRRIPLRGTGAGQRLQHRQRVVDQVTDQGLLRGRVIPVDRRLTRLAVVQRARRRDHRAGARHHPGHLPDRRHQLRDGVLGRNRVIEDRRVHAPLPPPGQDPGLRDHLRDRVKHPVRAAGGGDPLTPVHQRGRVKAQLQQRPAARHFPPQVELQRIRGLGIGQVKQFLEHQHRPHQVRRQRRAARPRREQVSGETIREQLTAVLSQEPEHAARRHQVPGHLPGVPKITVSP